MNARASLRTAGPAVLVGLLAFTLTVEWRAQGRGAAELGGRRQQMANIVATRQARSSELERRLAELRSQVDAASRLGGERLRELRRVSDLLAGPSGTTALTGPGVVVRLADGEGSADDPDARIQDVDIQAVVNALWEAGAEAIAVGGQRLVSTSAIRNAGRAVLVNYRVLASPYRVTAIGDPDLMRARFERSPVARRFRAWAGIYGLGFAVSSERRVDLPAFGGGLRFRYAHPAGGSDGR